MGYGDGSIYERGTGYAGQYYINGRKRYVYGKTKAETRQKLRDAKRAAEDLTQPDRGRDRLDTYCAWWLEHVKRPGVSRVTSVTTANYGYALKRLPNDLLAMRLVDIRPEDLQTAYAEMFERKLKPSSVYASHTRLKAALEYAVNTGRIPRNPAKLVTVRNDVEEKTLLTWKQLLAFLEATKGTRWGPLWTLLGLTGMRVGEALALDWAHIAETRLHIERSVHYDGANRWIGDVKSPRSNRHISLVPQIVEVLRQRKIDQKRERLKAPAWEASDLVFTQLDGGLLVPSETNDALGRDLRKHRFPRVTQHGFRHLYISHGADIGVRPEVMQRIVGHAHISITLQHYTHVREDTVDDAMRMIGGAV